MASTSVPSVGTPVKSPRDQCDATSSKIKSESHPVGGYPKVNVEYDSEEFELRKRLPSHFPFHKNDIYVSRRTNFKAQSERCQKLFDGGFVEVYIHGLGAAVNRAINLALQMKRRSLGTLEMGVNTSTMEVSDDLIPLLDDLPSQTRIRYVSAVHIKLYIPEAPPRTF